ncbi:MAG: hypothetical protein NTV34_20445, partial [Proteobacteria bacterium]|nr:hypothetical protein [Pseudomonadota bacterium]
ADIRLWVPVFVLLEDAGDDERLIHHLENILPKIEENLQALRNQPITPESLKASLGRARARISQRFNPSNSLDLKLRSTKDTLGYAQSNRAERIAAVQSQLLSAIPNISIQENHRSAEIANVIEREKATERVPERAIKHPAAMVGSSALNLSMDSDSFAFAEHHGTISALPTHEEGMVRENPPRDSLGSALRLEKLSEFEIDAVAAGANQSGLTEQPLEEAVQKEAPAQPAKKEDFAPVLDWRMIAMLQDCPQDATSRILRMSFDHDTEKHIALQVAAIVTGDFAILDQWKWRIWRSSAEFGYSLNGLSRQIDVGDLPHIKGSLYKFLLMLVPALSRCLKSRLNIEAILRKKNPMSQIVMRRLSADSAVILRTGLRHSIESLAAGRFSFVDTPELMTEVYVDPWSSSIHFSAEYCVNRPPGYLLHRVGFQT